MEIFLHFYKEEIFYCKKKRLGFRNPVLQARVDNSLVIELPLLYLWISKALQDLRAKQKKDEEHYLNLAKNIFLSLVMCRVCK